jgi:hypothetical protein
MARLFHTKITDLSGLSYSNRKEDKKFIKNDDLVLLTDKLNNYKSTVNELSTYIEKELLKSNTEIYGSWNFIKSPILYSNTYKAEEVTNIAIKKPTVLITKETVDGVYDWFIKLLDDLSTFIYHGPHLPSYVGMRLFSTLDTEEKVISIYGGVKWVQDYASAFIAGAKPGSERNHSSYAIDDPCNIINSDWRLLSMQGAIPSHNHTVSSSVGAESTKVSYKTYDPNWGPESIPFGRHGGKKFLVNVTPPTNAGCHSSSTVTLNTESMPYGEDAKEAFNNRPKYQCFYIWKRVL